MNYRHAFHAGNFADVLKHIVLARALLHLRAKETPFRAIDTHAGIGFYDLAGDEAGRTGEWEGGVGRLAEPFGPAVEALIAPYREALAATRARHGETVYPGSPALIREMLRRQDRAIFVELHPADGALLRERYNADPRTKVMTLDGWTALSALVPPKERRGIVLIDPPYEVTGEIDRLGRELAKAVRKWPTGIYLAWYPIKDPRPIDAMAAGLAETVGRPVLRLDLTVESPDDPSRLNGSGLLVVNPPWRLEEEAGVILAALANRLGRAGCGGWRSEVVRP